MLSCIYNEKPFVTKQEGFTLEDKYQLSRERQLLCPVCKTSVFFCADGEKVAHFNHYKLGDCPIGAYRSYDSSTTEPHDRLVGIFVDWVKEQFSEVQVYPDYYINHELFTDIYFELGQRKIAIEVQFKNFSNPAFIKRRALYKKYGIIDLWFFIQENDELSIGSPCQRTYYKTNRRQLYFYQSKKGICKVYKGFAGEKWEEVGKDTLHDFVSVEVPLNCLKIQQDGTVHIAELRSKYKQKLKEKREKNRKKRQVRWLKKEGVPEKKQMEPLQLPYSLTQQVKQRKTTVMQDKAYFQEYIAYRFGKENGKEYLHITIPLEGRETERKYSVVKKQVERNEMYLTCRLDGEVEDVRYSMEINPFLNSMKKIKIQRYEMR